MDRKLSFATLCCEFVLHYQPKIDLQTGNIMGAGLFDPVVAVRFVFIITAVPLFIKIGASIHYGVDVQNYTLKQPGMRFSRDSIMNIVLR